MEQKTFSIPNISCGHCTSAIERELKELEGVKDAQGNIQEKNVTVEWEAPATQEKILSTLREINYPAAE